MSQATDGGLLGSWIICFFLIFLMLLLICAGFVIMGFGSNCLVTLNYAHCSGFYGSAIAMIVCGVILVIGAVFVISATPQYFCGMGFCCSDARKKPVTSA